MARGDRLSVAEIHSMLAARVASLAPDLLPNGVRDGRHWATSSIDDVRTGRFSFKLNLSGGMAGHWTDFGAAKGSDDYSGDLIALIAMRKFGGRSDDAIKQAIQWAQRWLGVDVRDPADMATIRREAAAREAKANEEAERERQGKQRYAAALWSGSVAIEGTPVIAYLKGRGIDLADLGRPTRALRYNPSVSCPIRGGKHPAMIACILGLDGKLRGVHRTYLDVSGGKGGPVSAIKVAADPIERAKMLAVPPGTKGAKTHKLTVGPYQGGHIPLWKGECRATLRDIAPGTSVYVSEGIEDGLSVAIASPARRVVAAVALANIGGLELPRQAGPLVIIGQNDPVNSKAAASLEAAIKRQQAAGVKVSTMFPPEGVKDFNDLLMGRG